MPRVQATKAAQPSRNIFDPWNSCSTGHQVGDNNFSASAEWRESRTAKLREQLRAGPRGGKRMYDTAGPGRENFGKDGRKGNGSWEKGASGLRDKGQKAIWECMGGVKKGGVQRGFDGKGKGRLHDTDSVATGSTVMEEPPPEDLPESPAAALAPADEENKDKEHKKQIFENLCIYINGSTMPLVSDHKLKQWLAQHGARISIALGRRSVTHVILGTTSNNGGCGGGLAASKIQKEISRVGGKCIKYVTAEW
jgi:hypothetical protein